MQIDKINLNNLRVFECVYKSGCMTTASRELHLTQSGVSQHIKSLEERLDLKLFDRVNKKIIPTSAGQHLYQQTRPALNDIENALQSISQDSMEISTTVRIGMTIEFGNNLVIPKLAEWGRRYRNLKFNVNLDYATELNKLIVEGELDFAFVDSYQLDRRIQVDAVADEEWILCGTKEYFKDKGRVDFTKSYFEELDYISYQQGEPILRQWLSHNLKRKNMNLKVKAKITDTQGVSRFILNNLGVGILPDHLVDKLAKTNKNLVTIRNPKVGPLKNTISIAHLKNRTHSPAVAELLEYLLSFADK